MFIDIQGFSQLYRSERDSLWGLADLMEGVFLIGTNSTRLGISRIFAHHIGDGFVMVDDGGVTNANRLASAAVALHQFTLVRSSHFCGSAIAEGEMADVLHCYPKMVLDARVGESTARLGEGLMTLFPVMGTAIINTYRLLGAAHGSVIILAADQKAILDPGIHYVEEDGKLFVNWMTSESPMISEARTILGIEGVHEDDLRRRYEEAVKQNSCPQKWVSRTSRFLT